MNTKQKVLALLEQNRGNAVSGEIIASELGVSRAGIWKAINSLKQEGHDIQASTKKGYVLSESSGALSPGGLLPYLEDYVPVENIHIYPSLESTNKTAKELCLNGGMHGTVIIADCQTAGRGRHGRSFFSPAGSGLYISVILRPSELKLPSPALITIAAAVAVCRSIFEVTGKQPKIKWVNDPLLNGKKICGILTEAVTDLESGTIDWVVTGIGINITTDSFPAGLEGIAGAIFESTPERSVRSKLAAALINRLLLPKTWLDGKETIEYYRLHSAILGKEITVIEHDKTYTAMAQAIDDEGHLMVETTEGKIRILSSGEVSTKINNCQP